MAGGSMGFVQSSGQGRLGGASNIRGHEPNIYVALGLLRDGSEPHAMRVFAQASSSCSRGPAPARRYRPQNGRGRLQPGHQRSPSMRYAFRMFVVRALASC